MRRLPALLTAWLFCSCFGGVGAAPKTTVTLPDSGAYSFWVQSRGGTVSVLPTTVTHRADFTLPPGASAGDTLYVLDAHTGGVASRPLAAPGSALTLTVADFRPLAEQPVVPAPKPVPAPPPPAPHDSSESGVGRFFSWLLGLLVAAGAVWVVFRLVRTRGEPLIALARRLGIDVPDPKPLASDAERALPIYTPPQPRAVEKIPDEAGAPPPVRSRAEPSRTGIVPSGLPHLVGTQGLAAGSVFSLTDGVITVGRDGNNAIVLAESTVSRLHAKLVRDDEGQILVSDEGSANGVYVNGARVQQATLVPGDELKIGDNYFRFET